MIRDFYGKERNCRFQYNFITKIFESRILVQRTLLNVGNVVHTEIVCSLCTKNTKKSIKMRGMILITVRKKERVSRMRVKEKKSLEIG